MSYPGAAGRDASVSPSDSGSVVPRAFPRHCRITARRDFKAVYEKGLRHGSPSHTLFALPNAHGTSRLGLTVTRRVGSAVVRNRVKRLYRDIFRRHRASILPPIDLVVNVRPGVDLDDFIQREAEFLRSCSELTRRVRS